MLRSESAGPPTCPGGGCSTAPGARRRPSRRRRRARSRHRPGTRRIWLSGDTGASRGRPGRRSPRRAGRTGSRPSSSSASRPGWRVDELLRRRRRASAGACPSPPSRAAARTPAPPRPRPAYRDDPDDRLAANGLGDELLGRAVMNASPAPTSSGAPAMKSRYARTTWPAICAGYMSIPPSTIGPISCRRKWNAVTTPKFPPPPRRPQKRSGFSSSDATTLRPSAVTTSAREQVVAREAALAIDPAAAAAQRVAADAGARHAPAGHRQAVLLGGRVDLAPGARRPPTRTVRASASTVDAVQPAQVDARRRPSHTADAGDPVAAAVDRERHAVVARQADRGGDVVGVRAARDQGGPAIPHAVEHPAGVVVAVVAGAQSRPSKSGSSRSGVGARASAICDCYLLYRGRSPGCLRRGDRYYAAA